MNKVRRANFCGACAGTVMVELAIILPLLLFLLFGITELGRALYQQNMLTQAVELGGRYMARVEGAVSDDCSRVGETNGRWADAVAVAKNLIICGVDGTTGCADPILPNIVINDDDIAVCGPGNSDAPCASPPACVIVVKATAEFQGIFGDELVALPFLVNDSEGNEVPLSLEGVTLNASTQERYIGR